ncbi:hypothetical protein JAAARDRAFT_169119 [Jaapia argillacea MUCL 33604]|uniref:Protein kinase domain-containing protein n=1 Tax=Jaapia argillacea MUCL 33604 TaxID=933084 RepID=A0A067QB50_9AGAM|nr:hypothetical protein JAAARDRAFT_169119 [Jaapia argillacea MUCL 33604]
MALITPGHPSRNRPARALTFRRIYAPNSLPQTETDEETVPETTLWLVRLLTRLFVKAAVLSISKPLTIGRNPATWVQGSEGGIIVSCQDMSTNGILINGHKIRGTSVLLMDGDTLEIPNSQIFKCVHLWKQHLEKSRIFDPTPPQQLTYKRIGSYTVTSHCLGSGSFASVYVAIDGTAHRQVACKIMKMKSGSERRQVKTEVKILKKLNHPNINRIYEVDDQEKFIHIFLQLCTGGDLFTYITSQRQLCEGEAQYIMFQILKGLQYIHDRTISHRDLKPENILLYAPGAYPRIQIADFGLARLQSYQETLTACGTVAYLPPEGIAALDHPDKAYLGMPSDCWSVGVTLYIMLSCVQVILSQVISSPLPRRLIAITVADIPSTARQLRSILGMLILKTFPSQIFRHPRASMAVVARLRPVPKANSAEESQRTESLHMSFLLMIPCGNHCPTVRIY